MKQTLLVLVILTIGIALFGCFVGGVESMIEFIKAWMCFLCILCGLLIILFME